MKNIRDYIEAMNTNAMILTASTRPVRSEVNKGTVCWHIVWTWIDAQLGVLWGRGR